MRINGLFVFVVLTVIVFTIIHEADGVRGGSRGGSVRSGSRSSGSRSGSTSSGGTRSVTRFGTRSTYRGPSYSPGSWKTYAAVGTLYGLSSYQRRQRYLNSPDSEPQVCFNQQNLRNGTYGYFICPEEGQSDDMAYCCGDEDAQRCCEYADATAAARIIGIVIGVIAAGVVVAVVVYCVVMQMKRRQLFKTTTNYSHNPTMGMTPGVQYTANQTNNSSPPYTSSQPFTTNTPYNTDFQYGTKQDMTSYPPAADDTYDHINHSAVNGAAPYTALGPIGFDENPPIYFSRDKSAHPHNGVPASHNGVPAPPPYSTTPDTGFNGMPTEAPPPYGTTV